MGNDSEFDDHSPAKRTRETPTPPGSAELKKARVSPSGMPPMSHSFIGVEPVDEFVIEIADWIHNLVRNRPRGGPPGVIEVEAKLGLLKYKTSEDRVQFPVLTETIVVNTDHRFESDMSAAQHKHFNMMLNSLLDQNHQSRDKSPMTYQHTRLVDMFCRTSEGERLRVTRDQKTGKLVECIKKTRLGDLDVYSPKHKADWRVSVSLEQRYPEPPVDDTKQEFERNKDRISYKYEEFAIDLTQVTQKDKVTHEIEIEFARPELIEATATARGSEFVSSLEREAFDELIRVFVNNIRLLVRNT